VSGGFVHQAFALQDAETVLLVDGDEAEACELDIIFDEGVGADYELGLAGLNTLEGGGFFSGLQPAYEELDAVAAAFENAAGG
jgi:hypothetical protein